MDHLLTFEQLLRCRLNFLDLGKVTWTFKVSEGVIHFQTNKEMWTLFFIFLYYVALSMSAQLDKLSRSVFPCCLLGAIWGLY